MPGRIHILDVRDLPPCEPMEQTIAALEKLPTDDCLKVLLRREPHPLLPMLQQLGFCWQIQTDANLLVTMWVWHQHNKQVMSLIAADKN